VRKTQEGTDSCTAKPMRPYITIISRLYDESAKAGAYIDVGLNLRKVRKCKLSQKQGTGRKTTYVKCPMLSIRSYIQQNEPTYHMSRSRSATLPKFRIRYLVR
jgi:hypothetical protein